MAISESDRQRIYEEEAIRMKARRAAEVRTEARLALLGIGILTAAQIGCWALLDLVIAPVFLITVVAAIIATVVTLANR